MKTTDKSEGGFIIIDGPALAFDKKREFVARRLLPVLLLVKKYREKLNGTDPIMVL